MNIFFLDIDGVLNNLWFYQRLKSMGIDPLEHRHDPMYNIAKENIDTLRYLVEKTNAKIVITSTWRKDPFWINVNDSKEKKVQTFKDYFALHGWSDAPIIDLTDNLSGFRGQEVACWLDNNPETSRYLILDDDSDFFLKNIKKCSIQLLDRVGLYGKDLATISKNWSNQKLYIVNKVTGLTYPDVIRILKYWKIKDKMLKIDEDYIPYLKRYGFGHKKKV